MAHVSLTIPAMTGGVSQQPDGQRLATQCKSEVNAITSPTRGWEKRPPTEHVAVLPAGASLQGPQLVHWIDRSTGEQYVVVIGDETLRLFDLDGTEMTLLDKGGVAATQGVGGDFAYLSAADPEKDLQAVTVADHTIVWNRNTACAMKAATTTDRDPEGIIAVKQGSYATQYKVTVEWNDGGAKSRTVTVTTHYSNGDDASKTPASIPLAEDSIRTEHIAERLHHGLTTGAAAPEVTVSGDPLHADFTLNQKGSTIWIKVDKDLGNVLDFDLQVDDDVASANLEAFKDETDAFSRLPLFARQNFEIKVAEDAEQGSGGYYVRFDTTDGATMGDGKWVETVGQGIQDTLDETTMPHLLVRGTSANTFIWAPADGSVVDGVTLPTWGKRTVGDTDTNADPEFVGQKVNDVVFFKNRMVLLAGDSVSLSESGSAFSFFRSTVVSVLDSDRISTPVGDRKVVTVRHAVPMQQQLLMFADDSQHVLSGGETLTPKTVGITSTTHHRTDPVPGPVALGTSVFTAAQTGGSSLVRELVEVSTDRPKFESAEITAHVASYLKGRVIQLEATGDERMLLVRTDDDYSKIFLYRFFQNGEDRVQSAWSEWTFAGLVRGLRFYGATLYLLVEHGDEVCLEKMNVEEGAQDAGYGYLFALDRRINETNLSMTYSSTTDKTTITLPYEVDGFMAVYDRNGRKFAVIQLAGVNLLQVEGDVTGMQLWIGEVYEALRDFGGLYLQESAERGKVPFMRGYERIKRGEMVVEDSGFLDVEIAAPGVDTSIVKFRGAPLGGGAVTGVTTLADARLDLSVMGRARDTSVVMKNSSPFPSRVLSASFDIEALPRGSSRRKRR